MTLSTSLHHRLLPPSPPEYPPLPALFWLNPKLTIPPSCTHSLPYRLGSSSTRSLTTYMELNWICVSPLLLCSIPPRILYARFLSHSHTLSFQKDKLGWTIMIYPFLWRMPCAVIVHLLHGIVVVCPVMDAILSDALCFWLAWQRVHDVIGYSI